MYLFAHNSKLSKSKKQQSISETEEAPTGRLQPPER